MLFKEFEFPGGAADVVLSGTVVWPTTPKPTPCVVFINSSDVYEQSQKALSHRAFYLFCLKFVDKGFAVFRFDTRGTGKSTGDARTSTFDDAVVDVKAAIEALRKLSGIDPRRIFAMGHSDGGLLAANVGLHTPLAGVITLATPGCPMDAYLLHLAESAARAAGASKEYIEHQKSMDSAIYQTVLAPLDQSEARAKAALIIEKHLRTWPDAVPNPYVNLTDTAKKMAANIVEPPFRSYLRQNPTEVFRKLPCPILALFGEKDTEVPPELNFGPVQEAIAANGIPLSRAIMLNGLNHFFVETHQRFETIVKQGGNTVHNRAVDLIADWMDGLSRYAC